MSLESTSETPFSSVSFHDVSFGASSYLMSMTTARSPALHERYSHVESSTVAAGLKLTASLSVQPSIGHVPNCLRFEQSKAPSMSCVVKTLPSCTTRVVTDQRQADAGDLAADLHRPEVLAEDRLRHVDLDVAVRRVAALAAHRRVRVEVERGLVHAAVHVGARAVLGVLLARQRAGGVLRRGGERLLRLLRKAAALHLGELLDLLLLVGLDLIHGRALEVGELQLGVRDVRQLAQAALRVPRLLGVLVRHAAL